MGRVVLADGGFVGFTGMILPYLWGFDLTNTNYESLDNRLTYTDVKASFYLKLVVQRILYLVFFVKSKIFKDFF